MKKFLSLPLALSMALALTACGGSTDTGTTDDTTDDTTTETTAEPVEVVVFAAASMEATLTEIADLYAEVAPNVELIFTFDSSGTLRDQILEGATCDLFISAGQAQMNELDAVDTTGTNTWSRLQVKLFLK